MVDAVPGLADNPCATVLVLVSLYCATLVGSSSCCDKMRLSSGEIGVCPRWCQMLQTGWRKPHTSCCPSLCPKCRPVPPSLTVSCVPHFPGDYWKGIEYEQIEFCLRLNVRLSVRLAQLNNGGDFLEQLPFRPWRFRMHCEHEHVSHRWHLAHFSNPPLRFAPCCLQHYHLTLFCGQGAHDWRYADRLSAGTCRRWSATAFHCCHLRRRWRGPTRLSAWRQQCPGFGCAASAAQSPGGDGCDAHRMCGCCRGCLARRPTPRLPAASSFSSSDELCEKVCSNSSGLSAAIELPFFAVAQSNRLLLMIVQVGQRQLQADAGLQCSTWWLSPSPPGPTDGLRRLR